MKTKHTENMIASSIITKEDLEKQTEVLRDSSETCCSTNSENESVKEHEKTEKDVTVFFTLEGMSCVSCAEKIENALSELTGVREARINFIQREAVIVFDRDRISIEDLKEVVGKQGYVLMDETTSDIKKKDEDYNYSTGLKPYLIGMASSAGVVAFYLGLLTLTSDWYNARLEFREYGVWIIILALGLGLQATLFTLYRAWRRGESMKAAKYSLAASSGMSTTAMAACCAHYLALILPALGLPFLSAAAASLASYQVYFFMAGVFSNLFGIGVMIRMMHRSGMIQMRFSLIQSPLFFKK